MQVRPWSYCQVDLVLLQHILLLLVTVTAVYLSLPCLFCATCGVPYISVTDYSLFNLHLYLRHYILVYSIPMDDD